MTDASDILTFWFEELSPKDWWVGGAHIDATIGTRFSTVVGQAIRGELYAWRATPEGRLAEIICLDQFTRNMYRGTAAAFSGDAIALTLCQELILSGQIEALDGSHRHFALMPLMHSESRAIHIWARPLFDGPDSADMLESFDNHAKVVAEFGRYPSRNAALGRSSTPEEIAFLKDGPTWGQG